MSVEIELTQGQVAVVDDEDHERVKVYTWVAHWCPEINAFLAMASSREGAKSRLMYLHRFILNVPLGLVVSWRNDNPLDCRRSNLRLATRSEEHWNHRIGAANRSGFKGVSACKMTGRWRADIRVEGKTKNLGRFDDPVDAAFAYDEAARKHFGEFARLNFPEPGEASAFESRTKARPKISKSVTFRSPSRTVSGYRGVTRQGTSRWHVTLIVGGKRLHLGSYEDAAEAARVYDAAARRHLGKAAKLNFPNPGEAFARCVYRATTGQDLTLTAA